MTLGKDDLNKIEALLDKKLSPINEKLTKIADDLNDLRQHAGFDNLNGKLKIYKKELDDREEM